MTERRTLGDLDFAYELDQPDDDDGWFGRALIAGPASTPDAVDLRLDAPAEELAVGADDPDSDDTDQWYMPPAAEESTADEPVSTHVVQDRQRDVTPWTGVLAPCNGATVAVSTATTESWQSKMSNGGAWDFKASAAAPWYRSKRLVVASAAVAIAAIRGDRRPGVVARSRRRRVGVAGQLHHSRTEGRTEACRSRARAVQCTCSAAARAPTASAADRGRRDHRSRRHPALLPAEAVRSVAVGHAGDRGDSHTRHTGAVERDAASAAGSRPELVDTGRRPQARLGTLVTVRLPA